MPLNLTQLAAFHAVAEAGSVTSGAEQLMVSQPAVSKQIKELERATGTKLFDRWAKGVRLTDSGRVLADYARQWKADTTGWHFLTGSSDEIERIAAAVGMDYFPDEGVINHSLRTVVIDRAGRLHANVEGNRFTAQQLGDVVDAALARRPSR